MAAFKGRATGPLCYSRHIPLTRQSLPLPPESTYDNVRRGSGKQAIATTMAFVRLLKDLVRDKEFGSVEVGKFADLLVVEGDVLANIRLLEDRTRFVAVVQGGIVKAGRLA